MQIDNQEWNGNEDAFCWLCGVIAAGYKLGGKTIQADFQTIRDALPPEMVQDLAERLWEATMCVWPAPKWHRYHALLDELKEARYSNKRILEDLEAVRMANAE